MPLVLPHAMARVIHSRKLEDDMNRKQYIVTIRTDQENPDDVMDYMESAIENEAAEWFEGKISVTYEEKP